MAKCEKPTTTTDTPILLTFYTKNRTVALNYRLLTLTKNQYNFLWYLSDGPISYGELWQLIGAKSEGAFNQRLYYIRRIVGKDTIRVIVGWGLAFSKRVVVVKTE